MAAAASKDAATKQRIIQHMNKDHQDSLVRYLRHYCGVSSFSSRHAYMEDVTFADLTVATSASRRYTIPIKPPMTDWSEARPRVVAMDHEATAALNLSPITVKSYSKPTGIMLGILIAVTTAFIVFSSRANFEPGSFLYDSILHYVPTFARFCWQVQPLVLWPAVIIHGLETIWMAYSQLAKHSVPVGSQLWYIWIVSCLVEGRGTVVRFDRLVKAEEARRASAKH